MEHSEFLSQQTAQSKAEQTKNDQICLNKQKITTIEAQLTYKVA